METESETHKGKRTSLSIQDKLNIIERIKAGDSATNLALKFNVTRQAINRIKRSEPKILNTKNVLTNCDGNLKKKKYKATEDSLLDRKLYDWFKQRRSMGLVVTGVILKKKALQFNKKLGGKENFVASDGWLTCFKSRHGIKEKVIHGEKLSANIEGSDIFKEKIKNFREVTGIDLKYIYNCDETALYWKMMPMRTLVARDEKRAEGRKKPKNRLTILFCVNADGSHKIPLFVIGKYRKPRCFKNINHLPVHYVNQTNAWMPCDLMKTWYNSLFLPEIKKKHDLEKNPDIKIILIMDNAACHPPAEQLNQICSSCSIMYLPPNVTSLIQPLDQGIIEKFKRSYRGVFLERVLAEDELNGAQEYLKTVDLIECFNFCQLAWDSVSPNDVRNCWKNIIPLENNEDLPEIGNIELEDFQTLLKRIPEFQNFSVEEVNSWLNVDAEDCGWQVLTDDNILQETVPDSRSNNAVEELDDEVQYKDSPSLPTDSILDDNCPTFVEALGGFKVFLRWFNKNGENPAEYQPILQQLHQKLLKYLVNDTVL